jgi:hypothetical protein
MAAGFNGSSRCGRPFERQAQNWGDLSLVIYQWSLVIEEDGAGLCLLTMTNEK